jgi:hypothetical protein
MAAGQGRRSILTGPGAVSSHAAKGQPPASQRSGEPVLAASRRAGAVGPARDTALLAHRGPAAAVRAWLDGGVTRAVGRTLWRVRCTVHLLTRSAASATTGAGHDLRWRPEMHDPALAADRTWSPRQETARLAAFRPLAFPAGLLARYPAAGAAPPGAWPAARPNRPRTPLNNADRAGVWEEPSHACCWCPAGRSGLDGAWPGRRRVRTGWEAPVPGSGLAGQARTQAPSRRVSPCRSRVRRLIAAHRVCSQASFLAAPR